jgi:hypothetical protein
MISFKRSFKVCSGHDDEWREVRESAHIAKKTLKSGSGSQ